MTTVDVSTATRFCFKCGKQFSPISYKQKYCIDECRITHTKERNIALSQTEGLTKSCFTCGIEKPLSEYSLCYTAKYGVDNHCKECEKQKRRQETYGDEQTAKCEICGNDFLKAHGKTHCSPRCKQSARTLRNGGNPQPDRKPKPANPIIDGTRECTECNTVKPIDQYYFDARYNKHYGKCNDCRKEKARTTTKEHKKRQREKDPAAWARMRYEEQAKIAKRKAEIAGKDYRPWGHGKALQDKSIEKAYDHLAEQNARDAFKWWFAKKTDEQVAAWYEATGKPWNKPGLTAAEKWKIRYGSDTEFHLKQKLRLQEAKIFNRGDIGDKIRAALKRNGETPSLMKIIDYSMKELKTHLERQFTKGMTWDKFVSGDIHIDHIIPQCEFSLWELDDVKACWSLPNLRPIWAKENLAKSAKILTLL